MSTDRQTDGRTDGRTDRQTDTLNPVNPPNFVAGAIIKLGRNHPWVKVILNCSNKGLGTLQRGDNLKNAKMGLGYLKFSSKAIESGKLSKYTS